MKNCPYCAEEIQDEAIICRHCNKNVEVVNGKTKICKKCKEIIDVKQKKCPNCNRTQGLTKGAKIFLFILFLPVLAGLLSENNGSTSTIESTTVKDPIHSQFSAWDGHHIKLESILKETLKDPKSYEHISSTYNEVKLSGGGKGIVVFLKYRAKNSFGGYIVGEVKGYFDLNGNAVDLANWDM